MKDLVPCIIGAALINLVLIIPPVRRLHDRFWKWAGKKWIEAATNF